MPNESFDVFRTKDFFEVILLFSLTNSFREIKPSPDGVYFIFSPQAYEIIKNHYLGGVSVNSLALSKSFYHVKQILQRFGAKK